MSKEIFRYWLTKDNKVMVSKCRVLEEKVNSKGDTYYILKWLDKQSSTVVPEQDIDESVNREVMYSFRGDIREEYINKLICFYDKTIDNYSRKIEVTKKNKLKLLEQRDV